MSQESVDGRSVRFQHRRPEIFEAVMDYVLANGITDLSLRTLAKSVGVSHVTLRHHFGSKDELVSEIFEAIRAREPIPGSVESAEDGSALISELWSGWTDQKGERYFRLLFEAWGQALMHPERYPRFLEGVVVDWLDVISRLAITAGCPPDDAPRFATLLLAQLRGLQLDLLATGDRDRVQAAFDAVIEAISVEARYWERPAG